MTTTPTVSLTRFAPPMASALSSAALVGRMFQRVWRDPSSSEAFRQLRAAIGQLAQRARDDRLSPEESVVAFKRAIFRFGGVHTLPSLALEHHDDGDECAALYAEAFTIFVDAYFAPFPGRSSDH